MSVNKSKANDIKHCVRKQGMTLKEWAAAKGFKYRDVSDVVRGIRFGHYGVGRDILEELEKLTNEGYTFEEQGVTQSCNPSEKVTPSMSLK
jgi:gp16 family phage-associated protein